MYRYQMATLIIVNVLGLRGGMELRWLICYISFFMIGGLVGYIV